MDPINTNDIGNLLMNSEGTCPLCGNRLTVIAGLFSAREAGIEDISVCRCPQCQHVFRYELSSGQLVFSEDVTDSYAPNPQEEQPEEEMAEEPQKAPEETEEEGAEASESEAQEESEETEESQPDKVEETETKVCPLCGAAVPVMAQFCPKCGYSFTAEDSPEEPEETAPQAEDEAEEPAEEKPEEIIAIPVDMPVEIPAEIPEPEIQPAEEEKAAMVQPEEETVTEIIEEAIFRRETDEEEHLEEIPEEMKTCPKCGKSIPVRSQYCPYCRKHLVQSKAAAGLKKYRMPAAIAALVIALIVAAVVYLPNMAKRKSYNQALNLVKSGDYQQAIQAFDELGDYQKASQYAGYCRGVLDFNNGDYEGAKNHLSSIGAIENTYSYLSYITGIEKLATGSMKATDYTSAAEDFEKAKDIADAPSMATYATALARFMNDNNSEATSLFNTVISEGKIGTAYLNLAKEAVSYIDAVTRLENGEETAISDLSAVLADAGDLITRKSGPYGQYIEAMNAYNDKLYFTAWCAFNALDILDSEQKAASCIQSRPSSGIVYRSGSSKSVSLTIYDTSDDDDLFIKIYNSSDSLVETLYIRDGAKATAYLPTGSFRIALASGDGSKWFGTKETFGEEGRYQRLLLTGSAEYYSFKAGKYTLKFNVSNGNVNYTSSNYGDV